MSFADKKMNFTFGAPGASAGASAAEGSPEEEKAEPPAEAMSEGDASTEYTPDELGSALAESIKSGSGQAVYEAIAKIVENCSSGKM